jgi:arylformamidase
MKLLDLTIPLGIATPPWPTYEPLQVKYFKRLAPNGANGQVVTHSNHLGTHLDGEIHFHTPGKDMASLEMDFLFHDAAVVDLSDVCGDYDVYTSKMVEERVEVRPGDILIIHTGYHHFGWDMPTANEIRYMVMHPGPDREFADWAKAKKLRWIGLDCGSADHPMNTIIRDSKYQLMHLEMFPYGIIHAECIGGNLDLILNRRIPVGFFPWRFVDGEASIGRCVAMVEDDEFETLMAKKAELPKTKFGDAFNPAHVDRINAISKANLS